MILMITNIMLEMRDQMTGILTHKAIIGMIIMIMIVIPMELEIILIQ